ncbi:hypothetical protein [Simkania negevensis]|uniref:Deubiquitinase USP2 n=1 Tax=Simkania negevensis (strain ATCC VR-1471 / DSM 27360 / Z) TaxID=331113 RepID=DUBU2_SIMNZ|nr:hypothetical protein [Simkania negevensis]CCB89115.1 hypothetical protein SNE_A12380 [Simkania negevensis Z]
MTSNTYGLTEQQLSYNQAINDYLDRPSESTLNNLKVSHQENNIGDSALINDIAKQHFAEKNASVPNLKIRTITINAEMKLFMGEVIKPSEKTGLRNLGNTCWGNSTLQTFVLSNPDIDPLLTTPLEQRKSEPSEKFEARKAFQGNLKALKDEYSKESPDQTQITKLLTQVWTSDVLKSSSLRPMNQQEDAHEFLVLTYEALDADKHGQISFEERSKLVKPEETSHSTGGIHQIIITNPIGTDPTLQKTIDGMFKVETGVKASDNEGKEVRAKKNLYYSSTNVDVSVPLSLTVQMPRFAYSGTGQKVTTEIKGFDQKIRVPFHDDKGNVVKHGVYQVESVVIHFGTTLTSGHYISLVRTGPDSWEKRNDSDVRSITSEEAYKMMQENGYLVRMSRIEEAAVG